MKKKIINIALLMVCSVFSIARDDDGFEVTSSDKAYFTQLQHAILTDDEKWISKELSWYPFPVILPSGILRIKNEQELKTLFDKIFSPKIKKIVRNQSPDSLSESENGLMVGDGEIWFGELWVTNNGKAGFEYRITAIADPPIPMEDK
jgi:hypothetical protein